jgi:hypothetical protein
MDWLTRPRFLVRSGVFVSGSIGLLLSYADHINYSWLILKRRDDDSESRFSMVC